MKTSAVFYAAAERIEKSGVLLKDKYIRAWGPIGEARCLASAIVEAEGVVLRRGGVIHDAVQASASVKRFAEILDLENKDGYPVEDFNNQDDVGVDDAVAALRVAGDIELELERSAS